MAPTPRPVPVLLAILSAGLAGACARVEVHRLSPDEMSGGAAPGVRYYEPWPYLLVTDGAGKDGGPSASIVYLPRVDRQYTVNVVPGWGTVDGSVEFKDGWMLQSLGAKSDSKIPETITAITGLATAAAGIAKNAGGPGLAPGLYRLEFQNGVVVGAHRVELPDGPARGNGGDITPPAQTPAAPAPGTEKRAMNGEPPADLPPAAPADAKMAMAVRPHYAGAGGLAGVSDRVATLAGFPEAHLRAEIERRLAGVKGADGLSPYTVQELAQGLRLSQKAIYGPDDRREVEDAALTDPRIAREADSVVALFKAEDVRDNGDGTCTLATEPFGELYRLCPGEAFADQPAGAFCTGFVVGEDLVATAGHCAATPQIPPGRIRFVFGFRRTGGAFPTRVRTTEVYRGVRLVSSALTPAAADWAVVQVDRPIAGHAALPVRRQGRAPDRAPLFVIGHPCGLPAKYAGGAAIRDNTPEAFFVAPLDTYGGNSGSPVFNLVTREVEGILVRGEQDFVSDGTCRVSLVCPNTGCRGEDATRVTLIGPALAK